MINLAIPIIFCLPLRFYCSTVLFLFFVEKCAWNICFEIILLLRDFQDTPYFFCKLSSVSADIQVFTCSFLLFHIQIYHQEKSTDIENCWCNELLNIKHLLYTSTLYTYAHPKWDLFVSPDITLDFSVTRRWDEMRDKRREEMWFYLADWLNGLSGSLDDDWLIGLIGFGTL